MRMDCPARSDWNQALARRASSAPTLAAAQDTRPERSKRIRLA
jgi:hypothetical protein